jgi:hypothetical protein
MSLGFVTTSPTESAAGTTSTGARRRADGSVAGQLNTEWARLCADAGTNVAVGRWATSTAALAELGTLGELEPAVSAASPAVADQILLSLIRLHQAGDHLAGRAVLQLMLGKAIRIASSRAGRDSRQNLEQTAVTALWTVIATYPAHRRPTKVAANLAMDTLRLVTAELNHCQAETPASPDTLAATGEDRAPADEPADLELLNLLAWAVDHNTVSKADATLIMDIYCPAQGEEGGAAAAARHGLSWPAARQRASRAVRKITAAVRADALALASA